MMIMMMSKTQIFQQHARRILASSSRSGLFRRSYSTLRSQIKPDLEKWVKQGNDQVKPSYVRGLIKNLQDTKQSSQALEASEWMCQQRVFRVFPEDYAARLHLVETVLGMEEAEKFFKSIPENMRNYSVYDTLLGHYTRSENTLDKAESTFEKMRDLGFLLKPNPYNSMISLYGQLKKQDMVEKLQRELKVMDKSKEEEWSMEKPMRSLWEKYKKKGKFKKQGKVKDDECRSVISSLLKQNNVEEAEKKYREWYPNGPKLDMSIPNLLISRFCAEGNRSKVEEMVKSVRLKRIVMQLKMVVLCLGSLMGTVVVVGIMGFIVAAAMAAIGTGVVLFLKAFLFCLTFTLNHPFIFSSIIVSLICLFLLAGL